MELIQASAEEWLRAKKATRISIRWDKSVISSENVEKKENSEITLCGVIELVAMS